MTDREAVLRTISRGFYRNDTVGDITDAVLALAAPVTDAGLRGALLRIFDLAENRPDIRAVVTAALSRQADGAARPYLTSGEQRRLACVCGHPLIRHTEYGCIDCGTSEASSPQHNFTRTSRQAETETA